MKAIALLEVQAMVAAIAGLDAMVKTADVNLIHVEKRLGGRLVTVVVQGEVSAVQAAAAAGAAKGLHRAVAAGRIFWPASERRGDGAGILDRAPRLEPDRISKQRMRHCR